MKILDEVGFNKLAEWLKKLKSKIDDIYNWFSASKIEDMFDISTMSYLYLYGLVNSENSILIPLNNDLNTFLIEGIDNPVSGKLLINDKLFISNNKYGKDIIDDFAIIKYNNIEYLVVAQKSKYSIIIKPLQISDGIQLPIYYNNPVIFPDENYIVDITDKYSNGVYDQISMQLSSQM